MILDIKLYISKYLNIFQLLSEKAMCCLIYGVRLYNQLKIALKNDYNICKKDSLSYLNQSLEIYQEIVNFI